MGCARTIGEHGSPEALQQIQVLCVVLVEHNGALTIQVDNKMHLGRYRAKSGKNNKTETHVYGFAVKKAR